jgi:hypothetical protein
MTVVLQWIKWKLEMRSRRNKSEIFMQIVYPWWKACFRICCMRHTILELLFIVFFGIFIFYVFLPEQSTKHESRILKGDLIKPIKKIGPWIYFFF